MYSAPRVANSYGDSLAAGDVAAVYDLFETWRAIVDERDRFPAYEVSNFGRVRSFTRGRNKRPTVLSPKVTQWGYLEVAMVTDDGRRVMRKVHRLVAKAYVAGATSERCEVGHMDGNKRNAAADNLQWQTRVENQRHSEYEIGRKRRGKLTPNETRKVRRALGKGLSKYQIELNLAIGRRAIDRVARAARGAST